MRTIVIFVVLATTLLSCQRVKQETKEPPKGTPKALREDKSDVSSFVYKRGSEDLLDELYIELVKDNQNLKDIENLIEENSTEQKTLVDKFNAFNGKNESYYSSASNHWESIKDSVLRKKILSIIKTSSDNNSQKSSHMAALIRAIDTRNTSINDYHTAMKIIVTMPLIERYQKENLPKDSAYRVLLKQQDAIISKMDKIVKK